ncbi:ATP-binding cassette sub-family A member 5 [Platysternon megacephalum]|uniref:ATP-binding cassette sub-family A member 5 n=1 Tax=Platysternon megacephalum TaxID=55544 RepID=A0A4D9DPG1_9SAUR|nr:ATP-binding cassette sub-family A member 5 [Platysternon megacephalum]
MGPARWGRGRAMLAALGLLWAAGRALAQEVQMENMTVVEGGVAEINCRLHRYDGSIVVIQNPARQTLFFNGTRGRGAGRGPRESLTPDAVAGLSSQEQLGKVFRVSTSVRLRVERRDHGTIVTCEATHLALRGQRKQTQYVLDVQYSPTARIQPSQAVLREGDTLLLTCVVNGNPLPTEITWSRANDSLPERAQIEGAELTLPALNPGDNGTYTCQAANKHGRASDQYVLVVYDPGAIVEAQTSVPYAIVGGILALLVFTVICVLIGMVWCSIRQKGSYLTHEASGLDEHGEAREAFLNGGDGHKRKEEFFI